MWPGSGEYVFLLEVLVKNLSLANCPSLLQYRQSPLCPIVQLQVENSPAVYIPFLNKESVERHRELLKKGHTFLPLEIEESYLNNGIFSFNQGKSCLFTINLQSNTVGDSSYKAKMSISVLNGFTMPIQIFGTCRVALSLPTVQDPSQSSSLIGKLLLLNERRETVAHMCVSLTLSLLGHELARHTTITTQGPDQDIKNLNSNIIPRSQNKEVQVGSKNFDSEQAVALLQMRLKERLKLLSDGQTKVKEGEDVSLEQQDMTPVTDTQHERFSIAENTEEEIEEEFSSSERSTKGNKKLVKEYKNAHLRHLNGNVKNLLSVKYRGPNAESGKIWEDRVRKLYENTYENGYNSTDRKTSLMEGSEEVSKDEQKVSRKPKHKHSRSRVRSQHHLQDKHQEETLKHLTIDRRKMTKISRRQSWTYWPHKGWIRVTPVRKKVQGRNCIPSIKGTRTTLLRQCCIDPNLARQLQLEVERRMKEKLLLLDSQFKDLKAASRKLRRKRKDTTDVGSQTLQQESSRHTDFAQQTENRKPVTIEHWTSVGDSLKLSNGRWKASPFPTQKIEKKKEKRISGTKSRSKETLQNGSLPEAQNRTSNLPSSSPSTSHTENYVCRKSSIPDTRSVTSKTEKEGESDYNVSENNAIKRSKTPVTNKTRHELMQQQSRDSSETRHELMQQQSRDSSETRNELQPSGHSELKVTSMSDIPNQTSLDKEDGTNSSESVYRKLIAPAMDSKQSGDTSISSDISKGVRDWNVQKGEKTYVKNIDDEVKDNRKELHDWTSAKASKHQEVNSLNRKSSVSKGISESSEIEEESNLDYQENFFHESDDVISSDSVAEEVDDYSVISKAISEQKISSPDVSTQGREESEKKFGQTFVVGSTVEGSGTYTSGEAFISMGQVDSKVDSPIRSKLDWRSKDQEKQNYKFGRTFTLEEETKTGEMSDSKLYPKSTKSFKSQNSSGFPTTLEVARLSTESEEDNRMATFVKSGPEVNFSSPRAVDDIDSSISDISARIAQLLMRKSQEKITSIHTDSVSSYVPSSFIDETLSSLSDM